MPLILSRKVDWLFSDRINSYLHQFTALVTPLSSRSIFWITESRLIRVSWWKDNIVAFGIYILHIFEHDLWCIQIRRHDNLIWLTCSLLPFTANAQLLKEEGGLTTKRSSEPYSRVWPLGFTKSSPGFSVIARKKKVDFNINMSNSYTSSEIPSSCSNKN